MVVVLNFGGAVVNRGETMNEIRELDPYLISQSYHRGGPLVKRAKTWRRCHVCIFYRDS